MLYSISKNFVSRCELNKIKKTKAKASNKRSYSRSNSSTSGLDYDSSLYNASEWYEDRQTNERKRDK